MDAKSKQQLYKTLRRELGPDYMNQLIMLGTENLRHRAGKELTSFVAYPDRGDGFSEPH